MSPWARLNKMLQAITLLQCVLAQCAVNLIPAKCKVHSTAVVYGNIYQRHDFRTKRTMIYPFPALAAEKCCVISIVVLYTKWNRKPPFEQRTETVILTLTWFSSRCIVDIAVQFFVEKYVWLLMQLITEKYVLTALWTLHFKWILLSVQEIWAKTKLK